MDPVGPSGEFIIDYSVYDALQAGFNRVIFIIRKEIEQPFRATIGARVEKQVHTEYAFQEIVSLPAPFKAPEERTKPWGTVQAVLACAEALRTPFAVINADDFYGRDSYRVLYQAMEAMDPLGTEYCMAGFKLRNTLSEHGTVTRGICNATPLGILASLEEVSGLFVEGGKVRLTGAVGRSEALSGDELVSMNFWGFTPAVIPQFRRQFAEFLDASLYQAKAEFVIPTAVGRLVEAGLAKVRVLPTGGAWFGITHPQDKDEVTRRIGDLISRGEYPINLWASRE